MQHPLVTNLDYFSYGLSLRFGIKSHPRASVTSCLILASLLCDFFLFSIFKMLVLCVFLLFLSTPVGSMTTSG